MSKEAHQDIYSKNRNEIEDNISNYFFVSYVSLAKYINSSLQHSLLYNPDDILQEAYIKIRTAKKNALQKDGRTKIFHAKKAFFKYAKSTNGAPRPYRRGSLSATLR